VEVEGQRLNKPDDKFTVKITNTQEPNSNDPNDPARRLNVTVLVLSSDWSVTQVYPQGAASFEDIGPGETIPLEFEAYLPEGQTESVDIFKVFATRSTTNFRWLELPSLDEPITRSVTRSLSGDPLEALLAAATGEEAQTRAVRLTSSPEPDKGWTVAQVEMVVTEDGKEPKLAAPVVDEDMALRAAESAMAAGQATTVPVTGLDDFQILVDFPTPAMPPAAAQASAPRTSAAATPLPAAQIGMRGMGDAAKQIEQRSKNAITAAMGTIQAMALETDLMRKGIPGGSQPRMIKIKFGINLDFEVGALLAKSGVGATMEVEMEWARRSDDVLRVLRAETDVDGALFTDADASADASE
jgi:hypothetical protein